MPKSTQADHSKNLFFSYGHDEYSDLILKIREYFKNKKYNIAIDTEILYAGSGWEMRLEEAIEENEKFIFFITKHSTRREKPGSYCLKEITHADQFDKEIIPIKLEDSRIPIAINQLQYLDLSDIVSKKEDDNYLHDRLNHIIEVIEGEKKLDFEGEQAKVINELAPINFRQDFKRHSNIVGRDWVIDVVDDWMERSDSSVIWLTADAGYGKSTIAAYLAQYHPKAIGIHFCSNDSPSRNNPINIVKTMAFNFQTQIEGYYDEIKNIDLKKRDLSVLIDDLILTPLENTTKIDEKYLFIIDGIDEVGKNENGRIINPVSQMIRDKFVNLPPNICIVITSRPEPYLRSDFSHLKAHELSMQDNKNREDCREFIIEEISKKENLELPENYINTLLDRSENNMLYLYSFFNAVKNDLVSINEPHSFPLGLSGIYKKYFDIRFDSLEKYIKDYRPIFETITIYEDHIERELLSAIIGISLVELNQRINSIGSFIKEENERFYYYHKSLEDWLRDDKFSNYQIDLKSGKKRLYHFFKNIDIDMFGKFSNNVIFHYHFVKYCYEEYNDLAFYKDFVLHSKNLSQQVSLSIKAASIFIQEDEHMVGDMILLLAESLIKKEEPSNHIEHLLGIVEVRILKKEYTNRSENKIIENTFNKIDKAIDKNSNYVPEDTIKQYINILNDYLVHIEDPSYEKKIASHLQKNEKYLDKSSTSREDKIIILISSMVAVPTVISIIVALGGTALFTSIIATLSSKGAVSPIISAISAAIPVAMPGVVFLPVLPFALIGYIIFLITNKFIKRILCLRKKKQFIKYEKDLQDKINKNPQKWIEMYLKVIEVHIQCGTKEKAFKLIREAKNIVTKLYERNPNRWEETMKKVIGMAIKHNSRS